MEDIFTAAREGNVRYVRQWLENIENDLNEGDDHGFTPLHWASRDGQLVIVEMLIARGARVNARNEGGDAPLHLAASQGKKDVVIKLLQHKAQINAMNEHGNTALHYACFWNYQMVALELVSRGAPVMQCNKYDETPLEKTKTSLSNILREKARGLGQEMERIVYTESKANSHKQSADFLTLRSRNSGIDPDEVHFVEKLSDSVSGELYKGVWNSLAIVTKKLKVHGYHKRLNLLFHEEYPRLRIFNHPNVLPVVGAVTKSPQLMVVSQYMPYGSLYNLLHEGTGVVVDQMQAIKFAVDIAKGMAYLHSLEPLIPRLYLCSTHIMIDEDLTARMSMSDTRFSFQDHTKIYRPNWMSPEMLLHQPETVDQRAADMWSFAIILWELSTREVPFNNLSPMEMGMKIAMEGLRPTMLPGMAASMTKLIKICWNADPGKRPRFDQIIAILSKM